MKTKKNNQLNFRRDTIIELNDNQLNYVNGGTSPGGTVASSAGCGAAAVASSLGCFAATVVLAGSAYVIAQYDND